MAKTSLKYELIKAIEPIPMNSERKALLLSTIQNTEEPFSPEAIRGLIILLDVNNAMQNLPYSEDAVNQAWAPLRDLYNRLASTTPQAQIDLTDSIEQLFEYHTELTSEESLQKQPGSSRK